MQKLEKIIFYLLIFSIPFQTRFMVKGWGSGFNEFNGAFFYFTDALVILIVFWWSLRVLREKRCGEICKSSFWIILFFIVAGISLFKAVNLGIAVYQFVKLGEFVLLFLYVKDNVNRLIPLESVLKAFIASGIFQSFIAIGQFILQRNLGIVHFEAGPLGPQIPGVAKFTTGGLKIIRAYGTFPHPNVLAAFLIISIMGIFFFYLKQGGKTRRGFKLERFKFERFKLELILGVSLFILSLAFTLAFSRSAILSFGLALIGTVVYVLFDKTMIQKYRIELLKFFIVFFSICLITFVLLRSEIMSRAELSFTDQSLSLRMSFNELALSMIGENYTLGAGIGNFVWSYMNASLAVKLYAWLYQPVHNIYLLIAVEMGVVGLIVFLVFLSVLYWESVKKLIKLKMPDSKLLYVLFIFGSLSFLLIGFFDHFFWTLQQGRLMLWVVLGIIGGINNST